MAFIAFEGLDGSGKSTLMARLSKVLQDRGLKFELTREPGGTSLGEDLRHVLLKNRISPPVPRAELLLYEASRAQLVDQIIRPALSRGEWVLCDRYTSSSLAFQCGGRGLDESIVKYLNHLATSSLEPDLWVLIDLPVQESQQRLENRNHKDRYEQEHTDFHERVRQNYLGQVRQQPQNWLVLDGTLQPTELESRLLWELKVRKWL